MNSANSPQCNHTVTQGREGEKGFWCRDCGVKVLEVHDRPCGECRHAVGRPVHFGSWSCGKKLMAIFPEMRVTYYIDRSVSLGGLCFEPKEEQAS